MVAAETFFFVMALAWGSWQFILRRMYKHRSEMYRKQVLRKEFKNNHEVIINEVSMFHPERLN